MKQICKVILKNYKPPKSVINTLQKVLKGAKIEFLKLLKGAINRLINSFEL